MRPVRQAASPPRLLARQALLSQEVLHSQSWVQGVLHSQSWEMLTAECQLKMPLVLPMLLVLLAPLVLLLLPVLLVEVATQVQQQLVLGLRALRLRLSATWLLP